MIPLVDLHPSCHDLWHPLHDLVAKKDLINIAHMQHVDHATQVGSAHLPPCKVRIYNEQVLYVDSLVIQQLLKLKPIQQ